MKVAWVKYNKKHELCASQNVINILLDIEKYLNYDVMASYLTNVYTQTPPPDEPLYIYVENKYTEWYNINTFKDTGAYENSP